MSEEFYIGYVDRAPTATARFVKRAVIAAGAASLIIGITVVAAQKRFGTGTFEFGTTRVFDGTIYATPAPHLAAADGTYLLVARLKHGADVARFDGQSVRVHGTLVQREGGRMIELADVSPAAGATRAEPVQRLGIADLDGEIADSKCWLGVMNPGERKVHRDCASLCIRGGIPPLFIAPHVQAVMVTHDDRPMNEAVLGIVGEPVHVRGELLQRGGLKFLRVENMARLR